MEPRPVNVTVDRNTPVHIHVTKGKSGKKQSFDVCSQPQRAAFSEQTNTGVSFKHGPQTSKPGPPRHVASLRQGEELDLAQKERVDPRRQVNETAAAALEQARRCEGKMEDILRTVDDLRQVSNI